MKGNSIINISSSSIKQLANDKQKVQLCKDKGVKLHILPFMRNKELPQYISNLLQNDCGRFVFNQGNKLGLNLTECMTGASLSKNVFMNDYHMPNKYPMCSPSLHCTDAYQYRCFFHFNITLLRVCDALAI